MLAVNSANMPPATPNRTCGATKTQPEKNLTPAPVPNAASLLEKVRPPKLLR